MDQIYRFACRVRFEQRTTEFRRVVLLSAVVTFGHYGEVGSLNLFIKYIPSTFMIRYSLFQSFFFRLNWSSPAAGGWVETRHLTPY
jgi:hypothetical protein